MICEGALKSGCISTSECHNPSLEPSAMYVRFILQLQEIDDWVLMKSYMKIDKKTYRPSFEKDNFLPEETKGSTNRAPTIHLSW